MAHILPRTSGSWGTGPRRFVLSLLERLHTDSLLRNSLFIMATTVVNSAFGGVFWIVAARAYSPQAVGLAAALVSAWSLAAILSCTGIGSSLGQLLPTRSSGRAWATTVNAAFGGTILVGLCAGIITTVTLEISSNKFDILRHNPAFMLLFVLAVPLSALSIVQDAICFAERAGERLFLQNAAGALSKNLFAIALLPVAWIDAAKVCGAVIASVVCSMILAAIFMAQLGRGYRFVIRGVAAEARAMLGTVLGHHLVNVGAMAPTFLLPALVTIRRSPSDNAYYYTAWMIGGIFFIVSPAVSTALFVEGTHGANRLGERTLTSVKIITALLAPLMLVMLVVAPWILGLFGANYARHGVGLLDVLIVASIPDAVTNIYVATLRVRKRLVEAAALNLGMAALSVIFAWLLLPSMGIIGAGAAWLAAQIVGSIVVAGKVFREMADKHPCAQQPQPTNTVAGPLKD